MLKGKKLLLSKVLDSTGVFSLLKSIQKPNLIVLNFHRIYKAPLKTKFYDNVFNQTEKAFKEQMIWLKENFDIFSEQDLIDHLAGKKPLERRTAMITFDDGYIDNYTIAYPILKELDLPATYFIPCNQIDGSSLAWWDFIAYMVKHSNVSKTIINEKELSFDSEYGVKDAIGFLSWQYKLQKASDGRGFLEKIHSALKIDKTFEEINELSQKEFMTWDQIKEVSRENISIGSHTMSHDILANLPAEEQYKELIDSKEYLEEKLDLEIQSIAYPVGKVSHFTNETKELVKKAGYKSGLSFIKGYTQKAVKDKFAIPRFELSNKKALFKAETLLPNFF